MSSQTFAEAVVDVATSWIGGHWNRRCTMMQSGGPR